MPATTASTDATAPVLRHDAPSTVTVDPAGNNVWTSTDRTGESSASQLVWPAAIAAGSPVSSRATSSTAPRSPASPPVCTCRPPVADGEGCVAAAPGWAATAPRSARASTTTTTAVTPRATSATASSSKRPRRLIPSAPVHSCLRVARPEYRVTGRSQPIRCWRSPNLPTSLEGGCSRLRKAWRLRRCAITAGRSRRSPII